MFNEIIEYDKVLDAIIDYELSESQIDALLCILRENPTMTVPKILEITDHLANNNRIVLDSRTYSIDRILKESTSNISLFEITIPIILKHIPKGIIGYLTESHIHIIVDKILNLPFYESDNVNTLTRRIDEMFGSGDISIPIHGLRQEPISPVIVIRGMMAQPLHKGIQFSKEMYGSSHRSKEVNNCILGNALRDYTMIDMNSPLNQILPKFILVLKNMLGD